MSETEKEYRSIITICKTLFDKKNQDYGTSWRILRLPSITDQIFIKANRIRSIQIKGQQKVADDIKSEFIGIINYCVMALIQCELGDNNEQELSTEHVSQLYQKQVDETIALLMNKNHDYYEAWRSMRVSSITDIIIMKLFSTKQIEDNAGVTLVSEGVEANYQDMINYAVFAMILMNEV